MVGVRDSTRDHQRVVPVGPCPSHDPINGCGVRSIELLEALHVGALGREQLGFGTCGAHRLPWLGQLPLLDAFIGDEKRYPYALQFVTHDSSPSDERVCERVEVAELAVRLPGVRDVETRCAKREATGTSGLGSQFVPALSVELPPAAASATRARTLARDQLAAAAPREVIDVVAIVVTELVANAVLHAGTPIHLMLDVHPGEIRVEVEDGSSQRATRYEYGPEAVTGRGLALVERLSEAWGVEATPTGKCVWCIVANGPQRAATR